jgi:hypothetical protein
MNVGVVLLAAIFVIALVDWVRARFSGSGGNSSPQRIQIVVPQKQPFMRRLRRQGRETIVGVGIIAIVIVIIAHSSHSHR